MALRGWSHLAARSRVSGGLGAGRAVGGLELHGGGRGSRGAGARSRGEGGGDAGAQPPHQPPQQAVPAALGRAQPHVVAQLGGRHLQVARVPEHPPDEAEEDADAARVNEQVREEKVGEDPGQQHDQAQRVESQRQPEGGHAAAQPAGSGHGEGTRNSPGGRARPGTPLSEDTPPHTPEDKNPQVHTGIQWSPTVTMEEYGSVHFIDRWVNTQLETIQKATIS
ncbi:trithorax group protein osa-like [Mauremys mutica]|uniref:trithorax group protein osa-like n=1 Tax=Mauremys mutica TaxID=74926 RepID=UPI001D13D785|nr:trithorax group protein osa-like [Mauremys mutica]